MKKSTFLVILLLLTGCISNTLSVANHCNTAISVCESNYNILVQEIDRFKAKGGAFVLINLQNNEVLNSTSISSLGDFDYNRDYAYKANNLMKLFNKQQPETTAQFIQDYGHFIKHADKNKLKKLRENVTKGTARQTNIKGIKVYGLTATDYKTDNSKEVITTFMGHFIYNNKKYAIITMLDSPKGIRSTFGFNSSGWNATKLARRIVENCISNSKPKQ